MVYSTPMRAGAANRSTDKRSVSGVWENDPAGWAALRNEVRNRRIDSFEITYAISHSGHELAGIKSYIGHDYGTARNRVH